MIKQAIKNRLVRKRAEQYEKELLSKKDTYANWYQLRRRELVKALENRITFDREKETLSWSEYCSLGLIGSRSARIALCEKLHITYSNNKTLFRRLNMMGLTLKDIQELL